MLGIHVSGSNSGRSYGRINLVTIKCLCAHVSHALYLTCNVSHAEILNRVIRDSRHTSMSDTYIYGPKTLIAIYYEII